MFQEFSQANGGSATCALEVHNIWHVEADDSYDITTGVSKPHDILIFTIKGTGKIEFKNRSGITPRGNSFVRLDGRCLKRYRCWGKVWHFWWVGLRFSHPSPLPLNHVIPAKITAREHATLLNALRHLRSGQTEGRQLATSLVSGLLYQCLFDWKKNSTANPHRDTVARVIARMHQRVGTGWNVREMAGEAHLGERRFRQVFKAETGTSPKVFFDQLRMNHAAELLNLGIYSVARVARMTGFTNAFNFSRAFRRIKGFPPSEANKLSSPETTEQRVVI